MIIGIIAARWASTRFPGKPLADIHGKPMIWHVYQAAKAANIGQVFVATDDDRICEACKDLQMPWTMTSLSCRTSSDRTADAITAMMVSPSDVIVDIQGDEPMLTPPTINAAIDILLEHPEAQVSNLYAEIHDARELLDINTPKVVVSPDNHALYFSRAPIPYPRERDLARYLKQVCVYAFRPDALRAFAAQLQTPLELTEGIHMLRLLEMGYRIKMREVASNTMAVDTPADLERVRKAMVPA